jgi:hypothetical protein
MLQPYPRLPGGRKEGYRSVFSLIKTENIWTLRFEVSPVKKLLLWLAAFAVLCFTAWERVHDKGFITWYELLVAALIDFGIFGSIVFVACASTAAAFDLSLRRLSVSSERPWFGGARSFGFADVAAFELSWDIDDGGASWEVYLSLQDGARLKLGSEPARRKEQIQALFQEIGCATGIAVRIV